MNLEEMKVLWSAQGDRSMFVIDETALHARLRRSARRFQSVVVASHVSMAVTWIALGLWYLVPSVVQREQIHGLIAGGVLLALAAGQLISLARRRAGESHFPDSLRGDLDRAIWRIDYDIAWARALRRWYLVPFVAALLVDILAEPGATRLLAGAAMAALIAGASVAMDWEIRALYMTRRRRYEAVRDQLTEAAP